MQAGRLDRARWLWTPSVGWPAFVLVIIAVWMVSLGVADIDWVRQDLIFVSATQVGLVLATLLAHSRISGAWGAFVLSLSGVVFVAEGIGHFLLPFLGGQWGEAGDRLVGLGQLLASWAVALAGGPVQQNALAFTFVAAMILWVSTTWTVWRVLRGRESLLAILPLGVVLSVSTYLGNGSIGYVVGFVACVALALPVLHFESLERRWEREGVDYSPEIRLDVWRVASTVLTGILLLSLITPVFQIPSLVFSFWDTFEQPMKRVEDLLLRFFAGVQPAAPPEYPADVGPGVPGGRASASLPRAHLLGGNPMLSRQVVMYVCTDAPPLLLDELYPGESIGLQTYWRGITYDTFDGRSWSNGASIAEDVAPYGPVLTLEVTGTIELEQRYRIEARHGDALYAVSEPYQVDRPVRSVRRGVDDLIALQGTESEYVVRSRVPRPTTTQLEIAPETYQDQIVDRYLELSPGLPDRVRDLAARVSAGANTAYAKAVAIERYLRQFPYDLSVPSPPSGRNAVDYFLFDAQRGYCDYYASAFVVLARLSGVPSRLAVGYAMGDYDPELGCYVVTEMDAHSWPEVFFPGYGWVSFEPTAAFHPFDLPQETASSSQVTAHVPAVPDRPWYVVLREWARRSRRGWTTYVLGGAVAGALALIAVWAHSWYRRRHLPPQQRVALYYRGLTRAGRRFGAVCRSYHTPAEYQSMLLRALSSRVPRYPWVTERVGAILERARAQVLELTKAYELASYSIHPPDGFVTERSERRWGRLALVLWWLRIASRLEEA